MKNIALVARLYSAVQEWYATAATKAELGDRLNLVANTFKALEAAGGIDASPANQALPEDFRFGAGEYVRKKGGDYTFEGFVVAAFRKSTGAVRYVVEDDRGVLHVYSTANLELVTSRDLLPGGEVYVASELVRRTRSG